MFVLFKSEVVALFGLWGEGGRREGEGEGGKGKRGLGFDFHFLGTLSYESFFFFASVISSLMKRPLEKESERRKEK